MTLRTPGPAIGLVIALGSVAGCGSEEMFTLEVGANERLIETAATARLANPDRGLELPIVVGDLDGDGIDDAVLRSSFTAPGAAGTTVYGGALYVLTAAATSPARSTSRACRSCPHGLAHGQHTAQPHHCAGR